MVTRKPTGAYTQCSDRHLLLSDSFTNETSETGAHSCGIFVSTAAADVFARLYI